MGDASSLQESGQMRDDKFGAQRRHKPTARHAPSATHKSMAMCPNAVEASPRRWANDDRTNEAREASQTSIRESDSAAASHSEGDVTEEIGGLRCGDSCQRCCFGVDDGIGASMGRANEAILLALTDRDTKIGLLPWNESVRRANGTMLLALTDRDTKTGLPPRGESTCRANGTMLLALIDRDTKTGLPPCGEESARRLDGLCLSGE